MRNPVEAYLKSHAQTLASRVRELIAVQTINPPGRDYATMTALLRRRLQEVGLDARILVPARTLQRKVLGAEAEANPRANVLGTRRVRGARRTLHFNAHFDVVPVGGDWKHGSPFSGVVEGGWIHGRGTADMKGSIASLLLALEALHATGTEPRLNLEVSFTADEETDSLLGSDWLVRHAPISPDYAVVMEGGEEDSIGCGHNGVVWLEVTVHGRASHGSRPELGVNALEKMSALVLALEDYKRRIGRRVFVAPDGTRRVPTINVGGEFAQGPGGKINTVPALARFSIDRRVLPRENVAVVERELRTFLRTAAERIPACEISVTKISENHPCFSKPSSPFFKAMAGAVQSVRRRPTTFSVSSGFNDMHFFQHHLGIPTLGYGPGGCNEHAIDERARLRDLADCARIYAKLMTEFAG